MEGGQVIDFFDAFYYQSVEFIFKGESYFSDGRTSLSVGKSSFFVMRGKERGECLEDVYDFEGTSIPECIAAFENAPIWDGKTFWQAEQEMEWVDW